MKQTFLSLLMATIIASAIHSSATAQTSFKHIQSDPNFAAYAINDASNAGKEGVKDAEKNSKDSKANLKALKANARSAEDFKRAFKDVKNATWTISENFIMATFVTNNVKTRVDYTKKGHWIHTLTYFPADQTPDDIRQIIKWDFPGAAIASAVQVQEGHYDFFIVTISDHNSYKKVVVNEGESNVIEDLNRSN